ncbi:MAG: DUF3320 domain-containing protein [Methanomassiliicoccaceae archaeon]|nr:DUF3320 domain-containing protein [Methanomassiliicoccaceae archaeon]
MSTQNDQAVVERLERWRRNLIDTSIRNRLINFTESVGVLRLSRPEGSVIFDRLVVRGEELEIGLDEEGTDSSGMLLSDRDRAVVDRTLLNLRLKARAAQREQGINILFLSIGMLEWKDTSGQKLRSPLILIPAELRRSGPLQPYRVAAIDEGAVVNPILAHRLRTEYGLELPSMPSEQTSDPVNAAMKMVQEAVSPAGWMVSTGNYLGLFSFAKMVMYEELTAYRDLALEHPVVRALAGCPTELPSAGSISPEELDGGDDPSEIFQVLDADSSQQEAIALARKGVSFVLQGPPGTGKSQTIANIIAETLAKEKTVLFVSEKMAALEVVKRRLDERGLGDYCLELHSHKASRQEVAAELGRCLHPKATSVVETASLEELAGLRKRLNDHVEALHEIRPGAGISFHRINSELISLRSVPDLPVHFPNLHDMSVKDLEGIGPLAREVERDMHLLRKGHQHPWRDCILDSWKVSALPELEGLLTSSRDALEDALRRSSALAERFGMHAPATLSQIGSLIDHLRLAIDSPRPRANWFKEPQALREKLEEMREAYRKLDEEVEGLRARYDEGILSLDLDGIDQRMRTIYRSPFRWLRTSYWKDMRVLRKHRTSLMKLSLDEAAADVASALAVRQDAASVAALEAECSEALGEHFFGRSTEWEAIERMLDWCDSYCQRYGSPCPALEGLMAEGTESGSVTRELEELEAAAALVEGRMDAATSYFDLASLMAGRPVRDVGLDEMASWVKGHLDTIGQAQEWVRINGIRKGCAQHGLHELLTLAEEGKLPSKGLWDALRKRYYSLWHDHLMATDSRLREFDREMHAEAVERFRHLDRQQLDIATKRLSALLQKRREGLINDPSPALGTSMWVLRHEVNRKKGLKPLRELFTQAGDAILQLKPCLLMSPLSVSMHLDPSRIRFDLVIFDEASQIRPEDAIGAIMRGRQIIIVGDTMQLPPTDFFRENLDEEDEIPDLESILDECASCLPQRMLRWHYRSEDESLIAFSNLHFYSGRLFTFPSAGRAQGRGIDFVHVPEGCYDRGASRRNLPEAARVADMVIQHFRERPDLSLGVVAFSEAQQMAILEELESRIREQPELARHFKEGAHEEFFVKNLESIQGDERDVILFSLGYGKDARGKMHQSLGPLNRAGGERRLNVAVTRARKSLTVVSSILPQDLHPTSTGAKLLRQFMEYAMAGGDRDALSSEPEGEPLSPLEATMVKALEQKGLKVLPRWGCSGYRIDLAVEGANGDMSLAVETDGASYRSGPTARDRERLRQEMLVKLGWTVHRTWSSDWVRDPDVEVERIVRAAKAARSREIVEEAAPILPEPTESVLHEATVEEDICDGPTGEVMATTQAASSPLAEPTVTVAPYIQVDWSAYPGLTAKLRSQPDEALAEAIEAVVAAEGPVHQLVVHERIRELCKVAGIKKGFGQAEETSAIERLAAQGRLVQANNFLWPCGMDAPPVRRSTVGERRELWYVCMEELKSAIITLLEDESMDEKSLVKETTALYGYKRPSPEARRRINEAVEGLIASGQLVRTGEIIGKRF